MLSHYFRYLWENRYNRSLFGIVFAGNIKNWGKIEMKKIIYISLIALFTLGSCNSSLYTGVEYDDLYYQSTDQPVARAKTFDSQAGDEYYNNIYANDTLVSEEYSDAVDMNDNGNSTGYDYYDDFSYAGRLNRFHHNYFYPYWRDPFYYGFSGFGFGYPSFGYSYGYGYGYPYYDMYDPYYGYYDPFYSPYYGYGYGYGYNPYGWYGGWGGYYSGYYGGYYGYGSHYYDGNNLVQYRRSERPSTLSSRWNDNSGLTGGISRRGGSVYTSTPDTRRSASDVRSSAADQTQRRTYAGTLRQQDQSVTNGSRSSAASQRAANARPEYNNSNRTYTPSYNNPRMPTRPSYNNSRSSSENNTTVNRNQMSTTRSNDTRSSNQIYQRRESSSSPDQVYQRRESGSSSPSYSGRSSSGSSSGDRSYSRPSGNSYSRPSSSSPSSNRSYSAPSRSYSAPSYSRSSSERSYSEGSSYSGRSSSSYGGGSSYSGGSSSYSGGGSSYSGGSSSSSGGGSRSSSSGSSSSGGRRD